MFRDPLPSLAVLAAGVAVLGLFAWRQLALKDPLLNLRPLGNPGFAVGELLVMLGMMASFSLSILLPLYYEGALGFSPFLAGTLLAGPVLANALSDVVGGRLLDRRGIWPLVPFGFALTALGLAGVALAAGRPLLALVVLASAVAYVGLGLVVAPSKTTALVQLPSSLYAHASSINSAFIQIASAIGSSLFVGVLSADVLAGTSRGLARAAAYDEGFAHTMEIAIGIAVASLLVSLVYAYRLRRRKG
ncbi:MFS transporter [Gordonibacter urolithinfaciens]|uniref:MFS transporter n=1 Tax=Gordonibacter urolithinfaciens TaxID=1335613 RepID=UPI003A92EEAE